MQMFSFLWLVFGKVFNNAARMAWSPHPGHHFTIFLLVSAKSFVRVRVPETGKNKG